MEIKEFIYAIEKLYLNEKSSDCFIIDRLKEQSYDLLSLLNRLDDEGYKYLGLSRCVICSNIEYLYSSVVDSINNFLDGCFTESRDIIYELFFDKRNSKRVPLKVTTLDVNSSFFRMRESRSYDLYDVKEMFHIPFEKRELTTNQRFSISGYPCLYLGSSIYGCWEELHRPDLDLSNVVLLKNIERIRLLDLSIPKLNLQTIGVYDIYNIVLSLVCSLKVHNYNAPFKPEYIIPQNVLSCLVTRNRQPGALSFDGIRYTSTLYGSRRCIFYDKSLFDNCVIPIKKSKKRGLCYGLCKMFEISQPTTMSIDRLTRNSRGQMPIAPNDAGEYTPYELSEFGVLEDRLSKMELDVVRNIINK